MSKKINYCADCDIEFTVSHDADPELYAITNCPFCGLLLSDDEWYEIETTEEEEEL